MNIQNQFFWTVVVFVTGLVCSTQHVVIGHETLSNPPAIQFSAPVR